MNCGQCEFYLNRYAERSECYRFPPSGSGERTVRSIRKACGEFKERVETDKPKVEEKKEPEKPFKAIEEKTVATRKPDEQQSIRDAYFKSQKKRKTAQKCTES